MSVARNTFVSLAVVLLGIGLLMVFSASITARPSNNEQLYLSRQLTFLLIAVAAGGLSATLPASLWRRFAPWLLAGTVGLLILVLLPDVGHRVNGARRWLRLGAISLQPSELAKITLPLAICWWHYRERSRDGVTTVLVVLASIVVTALLVAVEPDLGTAVFLGGISMLTLFLCGWRLRYFALAAGLGLPAVLALVRLRAYQWQRITGLFAAWRDVDAAPYQVRQSLTTLGVGGTSGVGLGSGIQKLSFLPEANTDFVFAVVGEELGLIGTLGLIGLWIGLFLAGVRLVSSQREGSFERSAGMTLLAQLTLQAGLNMAVVTALVPPKGIALPLISYGGSSLVTSLITLGVIVSLSRPPRAPGWAVGGEALRVGEV